MVAEDRGDSQGRTIDDGPEDDDDGPEDDDDSEGQSRNRDERAGATADMRRDKEDDDDGPEGR